MAKRAGDAKVAVAYVRVSTDRQELGPEAQKASIESWAASCGVTIASWHVDAGVSGASPIEERPALLAALAGLRTHGAGVLVVAKRDRVARDIVIGATVERAASTNGARVARDIVIGATVERAASTNGAKLISADGAGNADGIEGMMVRGMTDLFAAVEREMIRSRTRAALAAKAAKGERTGEIAYGFRLAADGVHVEEDPAEQGVIACVRELRASGMSQRAIVKALADRGVVSRGGRPLGLSQVQRLLPRTA